MRLARFVVCGALALGLLAGCGDDDSGGGGGTGGGSQDTGTTEGAKVIDAKSMEGAKGEVIYCTGKDTTGETKAWTKAFNAKFESQGLTAKVVEFPASADEQRNQFIQRQEAKSGDCDVFRSDVIWTAEFAQQKWIYDMTAYMEEKKSQYIQSPLETATYDGKIWGAPSYANAAFLYYRTDKVESAPTTWQDVYAQAAKQGGIVYQGAPYEGLTCDYLELLFAAGGTVISEDGKKATIDSPESVKALQFMIDGLKDGAAPKAVTTYMEPESLSAWQTGKYAFMRNWPYAYALSQDTAKLKGKFKVAALPSFEGGGKAGILGGANSVISVFSKNPGGALTLVDFLSSPEWQTRLTAEFSVPSVLAATYDEPEVQKAIPFHKELKQAIEQAKARPVSPVYPQISQAIYKNVNTALSGQTSAEEAIKQAQGDIEKALASF